MKVARRLRELGSDVLILSDYASRERLQVAGRVTAADMLDEGSWRALADGLQHIAERLAEDGIRSVFHPHVGTYVETRDEIARLCELTDPDLIALCPDTGHLAYAGTDPNAFFKEYRDRIGYVHLKDIDAAILQSVREDHVGFIDAVRLGMFVELGNGMVAIPSIVEALRKADYSGWIIVEQDAPANPFQSAIANRRYLREKCDL